jgi:hypothetical protein
VFSIYNLVEFTASQANVCCVQSQCLVLFGATRMGPSSVQRNNSQDEAIQVNKIN